MCRVLKVARADFYQWLHKPMSDPAIEEQRPVGGIRNSYAASGGVYGARRVYGDLREAGEICNKNRVERRMRVHKIKAVREATRRRGLIAGRPSILSPNRLNREFTAAGPNQAWVTDIFDYIAVFYNRTRRHSHLGHVSPKAFERASL
jgi:putative transposase